MFARRLYRPPLRFEVEETTTEQGSISFVDKEFIFGWSDLMVIRKDPNKDFVLGLTSKPTKIRYPAFLGSGFVRPRKIRSWMRATMYAELSTELPDQQKLGVIRNMAELQLAGYPNALIRTMVAGITQKPVQRLRHWAQRYVQACKRAYGPGPMTRDDVHDEMWDLHATAYTAWQVAMDGGKVPPA